MTTELLYLFRFLEADVIAFLIVLALRRKMPEIWFERLGIIFAIGMVLGFALLVEELFRLKLIHPA